jgi:hypothetical protein
MLKVHVYLNRRTPLGHPSPELMSAVLGFKRHGLNPILRAKADVAPCVWGVRNKPAMASGERCLVLERGYFLNRFRWTSAGFGGLNGRADFRTENAGSERAAPHLHLVKPWRGHHDGAYVLLLGQVYGDAAVSNVDFPKWLAATARDLVRAGHRVRVRYHPLEPKRAPLPRENVVESADTPLSVDLAGAKWCVSYNSNSGVDAVLAGIPTVTVDKGAMAWDVTGHDPVTPPPMPDRTRWFERLAFCQWHEDAEAGAAELSSGAMWEHLRSGIAPVARKRA